MATIRLIQKLNRKDRNGNYPIYLVICHSSKRKEVALGVNVPKKYWNAKTETIAKTFPNATQLNYSLHERKSIVEGRMREYEAKGVSYSVEMLLDERRSTTPYIADIVESMMEERPLSISTKNHYKYTLNLIEEHIGKNATVTQLTQSVIKTFAHRLEETISDSSIRLVMSKLKAITSYAIDNGIATNDPFQGFKYGKRYKSSNRVYFLTKTQLSLLKEYFLNLITERNGELWTYKDNAFERLHCVRYSEESSLAHWFACFYLQGAAPIDVALLRLENVEKTILNGEGHYVISFKRRKTNQPVKVVLKRDMMATILLEHFLGTSKNGFVYPIITTPNPTAEQIKKTVRNVGIAHHRQFPKAISAVNKRIAQLNAEGFLQEELIDEKQFCLYTARHSFASLYLSQPHASLRGLASLLGRTVQQLDVYVHALTNEAEIAAEGIQGLI